MIYVWEGILSNKETHFDFGHLIVELTFAYKSPLLIS
jgi:hypothetical protein